MRPCSRCDLPAERYKELVHGSQLLWCVDVKGNRSGIEEGSVGVSTASTGSMGLVS